MNFTPLHCKSQVRLKCIFVIVNLLNFVTKQLHRKEKAQKLLDGKHFVIRNSWERDPDDTNQS
jgi:hypothetical protein